MTQTGNGDVVIEPAHYASDAEFAAVAAFWELSVRSYPGVVVPPPLMPMVLHAAAEDPTTAADLTTRRVVSADDAAEFATRLMSLIPAVTPQVQHRALQELVLYLEQDLASDGVAFRAGAQSAGFFRRAAALLNAAWHSSTTRWQFQTWPATAVLLLQTLMSFDAPLEFVNSGVLEPIVARLRTPLEGVRLADVDETASPADHSESSMFECLRVVATAASRSVTVRAHLRALGAIDAIFARESLDKRHLEALLALTAAPPDLHETDLPASLIERLGRCLVHKTTEEDGQRSRAAAEVLCNLIDDRSGPEQRIAAFLDVPWVPEHLYGTPGTLEHRSTSLLATRCAVLTERAVAAGLLRSSTVSALLARNPQFARQEFLDAARVFETAVQLAPQHAAEAIRNGLMQCLARALFSSSRSLFHGRTEALIAAAKSLEAAARTCDEGGVVATSLTASDIVAALNEVLSRDRDGWNDPRLDYFCPPTSSEIRAVTAAFAAAADALARHDEETFARVADRRAPRVKEALARLRQGQNSWSSSSSSSSSCSSRSDDEAGVPP